MRGENIRQTVYFDVYFSSRPGRVSWLKVSPIGAVVVKRTSIIKSCPRVPKYDRSIWRKALTHSLASKCFHSTPSSFYTIERARAGQSTPENVTSTKAVLILIFEFNYPRFKVALSRGVSDSDSLVLSLTLDSKTVFPGVKTKFLLRIRNPQQCNLPRLVAESFSSWICPGPKPKCRCF